MLEEGSFRGKTADFFFMFIFGGSLMIVSFQLQKFNSVQKWHARNDMLGITL
jgi:hypothetical protein